MSTWHTWGGSCAGVRWIGVAALLAGALNAAIALGQPPVTGVRDPAAEPKGLAYRVDPGRVEAIAAELRARHGSGEVRIAADNRLSQIIVFAPDAVHERIVAEIAGRFAHPTAGGAPPAASPPSSLDPQPRTEGARFAAGPAGPPPVREAVRRVHLLRNIAGEEFESRLHRLWPAPLNTSATANGAVATIRLVGGRGASATLEIDRRRNEVFIEASSVTADALARLVASLDEAEAPRTGSIQAVPVKRIGLPSVRRIEEVLTTIGDAAEAAPKLGEDVRWPGAKQPIRFGGDVLARLFQQTEQRQADDGALLAQVQGEQPGLGQPGAGQPPAGEAGAPLAAAEALASALGDDLALLGRVQIEIIDDILIIRGNPRDVAKVRQLIEQIDEAFRETAPDIQLVPLRHVGSQQMAELVNQVITEALTTRIGPITLRAVVKPNALLVIGRQESVAQAIELIQRLDTPVPPATQFEVFHLQHAGAAEMEQVIRNFYLGGPTGILAAPGAQTGATGEFERPGLGTRVKVVADFRSNALIVYASPRDLAEIRQLIQRLDVSEIPSTHEIRVFHLRNALAEELAPVLQTAISGQQLGVGAPGAPGAPGLAVPGQQTQVRSRVLQLMAVDSEGGRLMRSGVLTDVRVSADSRTNALIVSAPPDSMELIATLIQRLDELPPSEAQIKVFTILNGDAQALQTMLQSLFGQQIGAQAAAQFALQTAAGAGESTLVPLRFAVDLRTNSIIASGSVGDLTVVEAILLRLDEDDIRQRQIKVYRLRHAPALDVATALNQVLQSERQVQQISPGLVSAFEQIEQEVVVVPEPVSNSLIVAATPRFYDEVERIVRDLDAEPPMVLIKVMIAEISLNDFYEFGVELGLQDSLLFDRSTVVGNQLVPGFNFNNLPLGNANTPASLATRENLAGQSLTNFAMGRTSSETGYGGLVLSAANESVNILIRALQESSKAQILSRPSVMTLDNQPAFVQVGARVPRITSTQQTVTGTVNSTVLENVGLLLGVTPRISPDGLVIMEIDAENSSLGPESQGIPISINENGDVIRSPIINTTTAQTTVSARSGQTVILGGLITKNKTKIERKVPHLADIPLLGKLFRFDSVTEDRTELLIIMTPEIVRRKEDSDRLLQIESDRMSWCLADVIEIHGDIGVYGGPSPFGGPRPVVVYPDQDPTAESIPTPLGQPAPRSVPSGPMPLPEPVLPGLGPAVAPPGLPAPLPPGALAPPGAASNGPAMGVPAQPVSSRRPEQPGVLPSEARMAPSHLPSQAPPTWVGPPPHHAAVPPQPNGAYPAVPVGYQAPPAGYPAAPAGYQPPPAGQQPPPSAFPQGHALAPSQPAWR